jgi:hypothetical protein
MGDDAGTGAALGPPEGACTGAATGGTAIIGASAGAVDGICVGALDDGAAVGGTGRAGAGRTGGTADGNVGVRTGGIDGAVAGARANCWSDDIAMPRRYHRSWNTIGMGM